MIKELEYDKHNQNIDKVRKLYNDMIHASIIKKQKNNTIKLYEPVLQKWFEKQMLKLLEGEIK
jgi:hypothetical protein